MENVESASLLKIKLVANIIKRTAQLTFNYQLPNQSYSCAQLLQVVEFQNCSSKPFNLRVISKELGTEVFSQRSDQGMTSQPPKFYLNMYRVLDKLQRKSNKPIMIPMRALTDEEIKDISKLIQVVLNGKVKGKWTEFRVILQDLSADALMIYLNKHFSLGFWAKKLKISSLSNYLLEK